MDGDTTRRIEERLVRLQAGEQAAREELFAAAQERLLRLTRKMFHGRYPRLRSLEQTQDVFQDAALRLLQALTTVRPTTARDFLQLFSYHLRFALLDLIARDYGRKGQGNLVPLPADRSGDSERPGLDKSDHTHEPGKLAEWAEFHEQVAQLPEAGEVRLIFELRWYQELTFPEIAAVVYGDASDKHIRKAQRRYDAAAGELGRRLEAKRRAA